MILCICMLRSRVRSSFITMSQNRHHAAPQALHALVLLWWQELAALITLEDYRTEHHDDAFMRCQALHLTAMLKRHLQDLEA